MIKVIVVDDEKKFCESLSNMLSQLPDIELQLVAKCRTVKEAIHAINIHHPDLVFLDIEMPPGNGFEVLEQISNKSFEVILTTAFDQYAIKAIKFAALDYLLKPFGMQDLSEAMKRYEAKILCGKSQKHYEVLLDNIKLVSDSNKRLAIPTLSGYEFLKLGDIIRCESDSNYTQFYLIDKSKILVCKPLKDYAELLEDNGFFRIHQSNLINMSYIKKYSRGEGGTVKMTDGSEVEVSRRKRDEFIKKLTSIL